MTPNDHLFPISPIYLFNIHPLIIPQLDPKVPPPILSSLYRNPFLLPSEEYHFAFSPTPANTTLHRLTILHTVLTE
ncbi:hypothetical protein M440DRAFT_1016447 [Trichoderma longibrachiatum ATCC 18648]|uniref:Uncharacterized protein n=1 Tax=Trichoderma longibrachiatum ATCC 18648 TaxID=983965 RepID=A0A2T4CIR9_TRILO|nr:hypothetical protein M440DRAFT_1016447 [Trichoderma longibrachiatum ATCC 18648]